MSGAASMRTSIEVRADHPAFDGHFPGQPVWPGVCLLAEVLEALASPAGSAAFGPWPPGSGMPPLSAAKFLAPVRPGDRLELALTSTSGGIGFEVSRAEQCVARGQFTRATPGSATSASTTSGTTE